MRNVAREQYGGKPDVYGDYRKLLERPDVDLIINGTPDHWHTAVCVDACRAGKDIYTEKPLTLTIEEGKILSKVVAETGRIVQVGTQQRSDPRFQTAVELVRNGRIGKLRQVWVALPYYSTKGGPFATTTVPESLNWEMYQGQAPRREFCAQRTHKTFRWWYEYAGGIITDWGNHHMDIAQWGMDCELTSPISIEARGLFPNPPESQYYNTPDRFCGPYGIREWCRVALLLCFEPSVEIRSGGRSRSDAAGQSRLALRPRRSRGNQKVRSQWNHVSGRNGTPVRESRGPLRDTG